MAKKLSAWKTKGMNRDLSVSAFNPEFAFENRNLRLSTNEGNTQMSWVNEKGTAEISLDNPIEGTPIGTAIINHQLVLFTSDNENEKGSGNDRIYNLKYNSTKTGMECTLLYGGNLNFCILNPIETLVSYESESVQKVYWVDGRNQPRLINIADDSVLTRDSSYFDFVNDLALNETVTVKKLLGASGMFAPGVIQYAFTYYNKNGQETNIFYTTPLLYISYRERGASPEDKVENAFKIEVEGIDNRFDFLRIYSIQRTSINGTPICKRIQDIAIDGLESVSDKLCALYIDTGTSGDSIDPTELLYKGGEEISANTIEQKDNTLFLGNITLKGRDIETNISNLKADIKAGINITPGLRSFKPTLVSSNNYVYYNQLTSFKNGTEETEESVPCAGFKCGDYYRLGVQFQYKTGKWSNPVELWNTESGQERDWLQNKRPLFEDGIVSVPIFTGTISGTLAMELLNKGYKKVRPVVVFPSIQDRVVLCQGVVNPTLYTENGRYGEPIEEEPSQETTENAGETEEGEEDPNLGHLYAQSSWFYRPYIKDRKTAPIAYHNNGPAVSPYSPVDDETLLYTHKGIGENIPEGCHLFNPQTGGMRGVEVQGEFDDRDKFRIDRKCVTLDSPDIQFDEAFAVLDFENVTSYQIGNVTFSKTLSDIDIQTETPTCSSKGVGFTRKSFVEEESYGIVSGLFYDDFAVDDWHEKIEKNEWQRSPFKWLVYLWNKAGSLNNDFNRPKDMGVQSGLLKKKVISNLRYADTSWFTNPPEKEVSFLKNEIPQLFSSDEDTIVKLGGLIYRGNVDTLLSPKSSDGMYFAFDNDDFRAEHQDTSFQSYNWWKTFSKSESEDEDADLYHFTSGAWVPQGAKFGDLMLDIVINKSNVRMKYKSSPHLVFRLSEESTYDFDDVEYSLPIVEIRKENVDHTTIFGGKTSDALRENIWVPCGEAVPLNESGNPFSYDYGDTYYQRYDCLKTYPFTREDINQVVEIGSFMLETHTNIDGRYDRNRGQINNLNVSPQNFNLINPVYSQIDNFFSYRILPDSAYENTSFPNQITWSKTKENGADVDLWTNITLSSVLELDGDKGELNELIRFNDQLIAFQDTGISQILYNENVQIQSTDGVPIEIANSGKVQGKRYLSNTVGCSNKWSMIQTPLGIYFMDNNEKSIYLFNGQLNNISVAQGFNSWSKENIPSASRKWNPLFPLVSQKSDFTAFYDRLNQDVLFVNKDTALAFSEKFGTFTSFYDYGDTPFFENLDDTGIWIRRDHRLWMHRGSDNYCKFFGENKPYSMILVGNPEPQQDCIFTNLEFRACVDGEGMNGTPTALNVFDDTFDNTFRFTAPQPVDDKYRPFFPFDYLETWNEYQHGLAYLKDRDGHDWFKHHTNDSIGTLKRKFRMWRCDIPRDNYAGSGDVFDDSFDSTFRGTKRKTRPMDRMRNPWLYIKLMKNLDNTGRSLPRAEIHDFVMTYYV